MELTIQTRGGRPSKRFPLTVSLSSKQPTVGELKRQIEKQTKLGFHRQRITTLDKKLPLDDEDKKVVDFGVNDGDKLEIKDLGPQMCGFAIRKMFLYNLVGGRASLGASALGFSSVIGVLGFMSEYAGPLVIHPIFYFGSKLIYRQDFVHSRMQKIALALVVAHYAKRELETIFVHRFSSATMPLFNLFKKLVPFAFPPIPLLRAQALTPKERAFFSCGHYWGLSGLLLAPPLYGPWNGAQALKGTIRDTDKWIYAWVALWAFGELSNLSTHITLRNLRPAGTKTRAIPRGYGFGLVSCPNYFFETIAWVAFTGLTLDYAAAFFSVVAVVQMYVWAVKKHRRYRKEFGKDYPRGRKAMFPFLA
ncbi:BZ3500_MvSof-1268-A1-R1_Chr2-2g04943 [Microbotryum saponariae]|uniref:BZ3500_MvSof-1268-A1-R1_Chr2-2g04943 protein n=1 Tax=Microbotryum saponariae TaxID=289078 RepID=A0A2X0K631_9BASI|nr:BZ3500_MvSof-1268-A1-R1_Chr2-2g04943 [Microbotryum saponariae]SDA00530.1 BZ3501_MvSof-1269-A2-R1_Chr2-2g04617 [Microbotryum saponariae]